MKSISISAWVLLAGWWTVASQAAPIPTETVYTNTMRFRIPYQSDTAELEKLGAQEIRLYVSTDRGGHWERVQSVSPEAGRFDFQAPSEGEYWFAVRTLDARNRLYPSARVNEPELKVVVDTTPPALEIRLGQRSPGQIELTWKADDESLDPSTLRLEYLQSDTKQWQPVNVVPQASGRTSWSVPSGGVVEVRGSVRDRASNVGHAQDRTEVEAAQKAVPEPTLPAIQEPIASRTPLLNRSFPEHAAEDPLPPIMEPEATGLGDAEFAPRAADQSSTETTRTLTFQETASQGGPQNAFLAAPSTSRGGSWLGSNNVSPQPDAQARALAAPLRSDPSHPVDSPTILPQGDLALSPPDKFASPLQSSSSRTKYVNSRRFQIDYQVDDVNPSGVDGVALYITEDGGRKWYTYGEDPDRISPFEVEVPDDGLYGFSLRVRSGNELVGVPPQPGDAPSMLVVVDQMPPAAELLPVQQLHGPSHRIRIQWAVTDEHLLDKPIALSHSSQPDGPWEPISGWQPNSGRYDWDMGAVMPKALYIRLTARDAAGNTTQVRTSRPVIGDRSRPSARIVDVETADGVKRR